MQILHGVYLVSGFLYGQHENSYVVKVGNEGVMIDSGESDPGTFEFVQSNCRYWGIDISRLSHLFLTHEHFDHSSNAARLQQMGLKIVASKDTADAIESGDDRCIGYSLHRKYETCKVDLVVSDEQEMKIGNIKIRCISAPGHTNSSIIYEVVLEERILWFVGDVLFVGSEDWHSVRFGWPGAVDYDKNKYLETLRKLCHMPCDGLFAGHYQFYVGNVKRIVETAYEYAMKQSHDGFSPTG